MTFLQWVKTAVFAGGRGFGWNFGEMRVFGRGAENERLVCCMEVGGEGECHLSVVKTAHFTVKMPSSHSENNGDAGCCVNRCGVLRSPLLCVA